MTLAAAVYRSTTEDVGTFFWPQPETADLLPFRRADTDAVRPVEDIAIEELAGLAAELQGSGVEMDAGVVEMARLTGLKRLRAVSRERLEAAWRRASAGPADEAG